MPFCPSPNWVPGRHCLPKDWSKTPWGGREGEAEISQSCLSSAAASPLPPPPLGREREREKCNAFMHSTAEEGGRGRGGETDADAIEREGAGRRSARRRSLFCPLLLPSPPPPPLCKNLPRCSPARREGGHAAAARAPRTFVCLAPPPTEFACCTLSARRTAAAPTGRPVRPLGGGKLAKFSTVRAPSFPPPRVSVRFCRAGLPYSLATATATWMAADPVL